MGQYPVEGSGGVCKTLVIRLGWFDPNLAHHKTKFLIIFK